MVLKDQLSRRRGLRSTQRFLGLAFSLAVALGSVSPVSAQTFAYAYQYHLSSWSGVDGYIRVSGQVMSDPNANHHASWFSLSPGTTGSVAGGWVQIGQYQGTIGIAPCPGSQCVRTVQFVHGYWENKLPCTGFTFYDVGDTGDVHADPNVAYYVNRIGTGVSPCDTTQQKWAFRVGGYLNPPVAYGYLSSATGWSEAATENYYTGAPEPLGLDRLGLNDSNGVDDSYGLHLKSPSTGSWLLWSPANAPNTMALDDNPPFYYGVKAWSAFRTDDV